MHLADYGFKEWLSAECLRPIKRKHLRVMWSAQRCHLVDICPVSGDNWPQETCEVLLNLVNEKKCFIRNNKVYLCLCFSLPFARHHPSYGDCLEVKREYYQNCSVLGCVSM